VQKGCKSYFGDCHHLRLDLCDIKFMGDKLLCAQVPDPFPRCGIGSGHTRLHKCRGSPGSHSQSVSCTH